MRSASARMRITLKCDLFWIRHNRRLNVSEFSEEKKIKDIVLVEYWFDVAWIQTEINRSLCGRAHGLIVRFDFRVNQVFVLDIAIECVG